MAQLMTDVDMRVALGTGHVFAFKANEPIDIPDKLVDECRRKGAFPAGQSPPKKEVDPDPEGVISALSDVVNEIMQSGDPNLLTTDRLPRMTEVKRRMEVDFTKAQFNAALQRLDGNG